MTHIPPHLRLIHKIKIHTETGDVGIYCRIVDGGDPAYDRDAEYGVGCTDREITCPRCRELLGVTGPTLKEILCDSITIRITAMLYHRDLIAWENTNGQTLDFDGRDAEAINAVIESCKWSDDKIRQIMDVLKSIADKKLIEDWPEVIEGQHD